MNRARNKRKKMKQKSNSIGYESVLDFLDSIEMRHIYTHRIQLFYTNLPKNRQY